MGGGVEATNDKNILEIMPYLKMSELNLAEQLLKTKMVKWLKTILNE